jgi:hypothetical protein
MEQAESYSESSTAVVAHEDSARGPDEAELRLTRTVPIGIGCTLPLQLGHLADSRAPRPLVCALGRADTLRRPRLEGPLSELDLDAPRQLARGGLRLMGWTQPHFPIRPWPRPR